MKLNWFAATHFCDKILFTPIAITLIGKRLFAVRNICDDKAITNFGKFLARKQKLGYSKFRVDR